MKGDSACHTYSAQGQRNYDRISQDHVPVGPSVVWVNRFYPDKTMTLPVGVSAGKDWARRV